MYAFVYGTLKKGRGNHGVMYPGNEEPVFLGEAITIDPFVMTSCGFPYVIDPDFSLKEPKQIKGELYLINNNILPSLDMLEGFYEEGHQHNHYNREVRKVTTEDGQMYDAYMYVANSDEEMYEDSLPVCDTEEFMGQKVYVY
jgi:gamma-glutamylcyclotransferase (GGCT)/AIG2-like uncharacterized protein YtfP